MIEVDLCYRRKVEMYFYLQLKP